MSRFARHIGSLMLAACLTAIALVSLPTTADAVVQSTGLSVRGMCTGTAPQTSYNGLLASGNFTGLGSSAWYLFTIGPSDGVLIQSNATGSLTTTTFAVNAQQTALIAGTTYPWTLAAYDSQTGVIGSVVISGSATVINPDCAPNSYVETAAANCGSSTVTLNIFGRIPTKPDSAMVLSVGTATSLTFGVATSSDISGNFSFSLTTAISAGQSSLVWYVTSIKSPSSNIYLTGTATWTPCKGGVVVTPPTRMCAKVLFIGVRGSGETASDHDGYGADVAAIRQSLASSLSPAVSMDSIPIDYAAAAVDASLLTPAGRNAYFASINQGVSQLTIALNKSVANCTGASAQKWVIAGFSQGAMVINQVVRNYPDLSHFLQIDLIADPDRVPDQNASNSGSAAQGFGIYPSLYNANYPKLPAALKQVTNSLCDSRDIVCDFSNNPQSLVDYVSGTLTHLSYNTRDAVTLAAMGVRAAADVHP
jgi:hypothetical protein